MLDRNLKILSLDSGASTELRRDLANRHIQLIAIGGCIGTGLFMGSGKSIAASGPAILIVYSVIGVMLYFMMRAMGELLLSDLRYRSFADCAEDLLGPFAGFATGWSYWLAWIITAMAELIAVSGYASFWWPEIPPWVPVPIALAGLIAANLMTVRLFGEFEFWFAMIKILAILALIVVGIVLVSSHHIGELGNPAKVSNLWTHGGIFPTGWPGVTIGFATAIFAFVGMEIVGTTAAEVKHPEQVLPRAINAIPTRILMFYVGSLAILMMVTPWQIIPSNSSPFVGMFNESGFKASASFVNFIALTSALSSINSGLYSTSRMLFGLSTRGHAPKLFSRISSRGVPFPALLLGGFLLLVPAGVLGMGTRMMDAFQWVACAASLLFLLIWTLIVLSYFAYRQRHPDRHRRAAFRLPWGIPTGICVLLFFSFILWTLERNPEVGNILWALPAWLILMLLWYRLGIRPSGRSSP